MRAADRVPASAVVAITNCNFSSTSASNCCFEGGEGGGTWSPHRAAQRSGAARDSGPGMPLARSRWTNRLLLKFFVVPLFQEHDTGHSQAHLDSDGGIAFQASKPEVRSRRPQQHESTFLPILPRRLVIGGARDGHTYASISTVLRVVTRSLNVSAANLRRTSELTIRPPPSARPTQTRWTSIAATRAPSRYDLIAAIARCSFRAPSPSTFQHLHSCGLQRCRTYALSAASLWGCETTPAGLRRRRRCTRG